MILWIYFNFINTLVIGVSRSFDHFLALKFGQKCILNFSGSQINPQKENLAVETKGRGIYWPTVKENIG